MIDYWLIAFLKLTECQRRATKENDPYFVAKALEWARSDVLRAIKGQNRQGKRKGKNVAQATQDNFEDEQTRYGLNGTDLVNKALKNRFGGKVVTQELDET